jgi:DNA-binding NtrC family response regulator
MKGAFTGAATRRTVNLKKPIGTLFLDEIGELILTSRQIVGEYSGKRDNPY